MSQILRLAIVDPNDATRAELKTLLVGSEIVWLEAECSRYEFFLDVVRESNPDIAVVSVDAGSRQALELIRKIQSEYPSVIVLAASPTTDGQTILGAMRAGAKEFLPIPITKEELDTTLLRVGGSILASGNGRTRSCEIIAIAGATGGVGSTSIAVNLAAILCDQPGNSVVLLDLDLALGDADVFLDAIPEYTLADVTLNTSRLDLQLLKKTLTKHSSGLYLLSRPVELQEAQHIRPDGISKVIGLLKNSFTHVIIDLSKSYTNIDMAALQVATDVILVTQLDLPCLRNVVRLLVSFEEFDPLPSKTHVIVNRAGLGAGQISPKKATEILGREIFAQIPNDYRTMVEVRNNGVSLIEHAPKAAITVALRDLLAKLSQSEVPKGDAENAASVAPVSGWKKFWPGSRT